MLFFYFVVHSHGPMTLVIVTCLILVLIVILSSKRIRT